jgi:hypothetical protein
MMAGDIERALDDLGFLETIAEQGARTKEAEQEIMDAVKRIKEALAPVADDAVREAVAIMSACVGNSASPAFIDAGKTLIRAAQQNTKKWTREEWDRVWWDAYNKSCGANVFNEIPSFQQVITEALITAGVIEVQS